MSSFEWMELQTLNADISAARSRLAAARADRNPGAVRILEEEITAAEARRSLLLAQITNHVAGDPEAAADPVPAGKPAAAAPADPQPSGKPARDGELAMEAVEPGRSSGGSVVWNELTPGDLERAKREIELRRAETLARHAAELQALEQDQGELDALVQAIEAFTRKFSLTPPKAEVVALDEERELRAQGRG